MINFCSDHCIDSRLAQENEKKCENAFQQVVHSIKRADYQDIGINFIALPEFFEVPLSMLGGENVLARFVTGVFSQKDLVSHYLLFRL